MTQAQNEAENSSNSSKSVDIRQIQHILGPTPYKLTPATLAHKMTAGKWLTPKHVLKLSAILAKSLTEGNARLIVSIPPRHSKSETGSIRTPVWYFDRNPSHKIGLCSYGADLATGFSRQVRDIIIQDHAENIGDNYLDVYIEGKKVDDWTTTENGGMYAVGVGGTLYGRGVHVLFVDDYYKNPEEAESESYRNKVYDWFSVIASTRIEPGGSIVIIATRWHKDDLSGRLLKMPDSSWRELRIPGIAEENDPMGRAPGEALWPERYDIDALNSWRATMGSYYFDAIVQQKPRASKSNLFQDHYIQVIPEAPYGPDWVSYRSWDFAGTEEGGGGDYTVGTRMLFNKTTRKVVIADIKRVQLTPGGVEELVIATAHEDTKNTKILIGQEPGSSGKAVVHNFASKLKGFSVEGIRETGSKFVRAQPFFAAAEHSFVSIVRGPYVAPFISELTSFPSGEHDDQVDTVSTGYNKVFDAKKTGGAFGRNKDSSPTFGQLTYLNNQIIAPTAVELAKYSRTTRSCTWGRRRAA